MAKFSKIVLTFSLLFFSSCPQTAQGGTSIEHQAKSYLKRLRYSKIKLGVKSGYVCRAVAYNWEATRNGENLRGSICCSSNACILMYEFRVDPPKCSP